MEIMYEMNLGRLDTFFAKRLLAKGPDELERMCNGKSPLFNTVVKYKWRHDPFVKHARKVSRYLHWIKLFDDESYCLAKKEVFNFAKQTSPNQCVYKAFVSLVENPKPDSRLESIINDTFACNPKLNDAALRIVDRTDELDAKGLSYDADYNVKKIKAFDMARVHIVFAWLVCKFELPFLWRYIKQYANALGSEIRHGASICFWPGNEDVREFFENEVYDEYYILSVHKHALDSMEKTVSDLFQEQKQSVHKKHSDIARYKQMIATKQLLPFKKK